MRALETTVSIDDHRLVIQDAALPDHAEHARVIVMWESAKPAGRRLPPPALAGMGEEKGDTSLRAIVVRHASCRG